VKEPEASRTNEPTPAADSDDGADGVQVTDIASANDS
jgi:hypothetical protein